MGTKTRSYYLISDLHEKHDNLSQFASFLENQDPFDAIIAAGDFTDNWRCSEDLLVEKMSSTIGHFDNFDVIGVHGNHDPDEAFAKALKDHSNFNYIHDSYYNDGDYAFIGYGGVEKPKPESSHSGSPKSYKQIYEGLSGGIKAAKKDGVLPRDMVVVVHDPARGILDGIAGGHIHIGSQAVRDVVDKYTPGFVICGHIHQEFGAKIRVKTKKGYRSKYLPKYDDGVHSFYGVIIEKENNHYHITYNKNEVDASLFMNAGTLGYQKTYHHLEWSDNGNERVIDLDIEKLPKTAYDVEIEDLDFSSYSFEM